MSPKAVGFSLAHSSCPSTYNAPEKGTSDTAFKLCSVDLQSDLTRNLNSQPSAKLHQKWTNEIARTPLDKNNLKMQPDKVDCTEVF